MLKRIDRPEKERDALATKIEADLRMLRRAGRALDCHDTQVGSVARCLSFYVADGYSLGELEVSTAELVTTDSILRSPAEGSPEDIAEKAEAKAKAGHTRSEYAAMSATERLEAINKRSQAERDTAEAEARKAEVTKNNFDKAQPTTASQRLSMANSWRGVGIDLGELEAKPPTPEQMKKLDANRRLAAANLAALALAKKKAKS